MWGCLSKVRIYNLQGNKLDARTISGYFIGYAEKSKGGSRFYCPSDTTRIMESRNAKFLENDFNGSGQFHDTLSEKIIIKVKPLVQVID